MSTPAAPPSEGEGEASPPRPALSRTKKLAFALLTVIVLIALGEAGLRLAGINSSPLNQFRLGVCGELLARYDEDLFWREDPPHSPSFLERPRGRQLRIAVMADSVAVMGHAPYPVQLQALLMRQMPEIPVNLFNASVPGYTSFQGLKYYTSLVLPHEPDLAIVAFGHNDHWQSGNGLTDQLQRPPVRGRLARVVGSSRLVGLLASLVLKHRQKSYHFWGPEESMRVPLKDYESNLQGFVEASRRQGVRLIFMAAAYLDTRQVWVAVHARYNAVVRQVAQRNGVPVIDLVDRLKHRPDLYLDPGHDRVHINEKGATIVARALADAIVAMADAGAFPRHRSQGGPR
jgi:lysophospholipase L1-like esterase